MKKSIHAHAASLLQFGAFFHFYATCHEISMPHAVKFLRRTHSTRFDTRVFNRKFTRRRCIKPGYAFT